MPGRLRGRSPQMCSTLRTAGCEFPPPAVRRLNFRANAYRIFLAEARDVGTRRVQR